MRRGAIGILSLDSDRAPRENLAKQDSLFWLDYHIETTIYRRNEKEETKYCVLYIQFKKYEKI